MNEVTLTRDQWNSIWDAVKQMREHGSDLCCLRDALETLGLTKAVTQIETSQSGIGDCASGILSILIAAEDAMGAAP